MVEKEKAADEYEQAKKKIDAHCKSIGAEMGVGQNKTIILNGFTITLKTHEGSSYDVPMDIKKQYSKKITITRKTIDAIDDHKEKHNGEQ
jgi:hypothetical protein